MTTDAADPDVTTELVLAPAVGSASVGACLDRIASDEPGFDSVVAVTVTGSAADWLERWDRHDELSSTSVTCVDATERTRSTAFSGADPTREVTADATVQRVDRATDLERVGRKVSDVLQRADEGGERVGVAVHSLSDVVQRVDEATAFKFAYTLGEVVRRVDGTAYFHLDPAAHDEETVETFTVVCDRVTDADAEVPVGDSADPR